MNDAIRAAKVRLVDDEGAQLGVVEVREAARLAEEKGLDLVEVSPNTTPPVCRIMDYGKYRFEQEKKKKIAKKKQHIVQLKEIRFKIRIEEHETEKSKFENDFMRCVRIELRAISIF